jgi:hypothetical protein
LSVEKPELARRAIRYSGVKAIIARYVIPPPGSPGGDPKVQPK